MLNQKMNLALRFPVWKNCGEFIKIFPLKQKARIRWTPLNLEQPLREMFDSSLTLEKFIQLSKQFEQMLTEFCTILLRTFNGSPANGVMDGPLAKGMVESIADFNENLIKSQNLVINNIKKTNIASEYLIYWITRCQTDKEINPLIVISRKNKAILEQGEDSNNKSIEYIYESIDSYGFICINALLIGIRENKSPVKCYKIIELTSSHIAMLLQSFRNTLSSLNNENDQVPSVWSEEMKNNYILAISRHLGNYNTIIKAFTLIQTRCWREAKELLTREDLEAPHAQLLKSLHERLTSGKPIPVWRPEIEPMSSKAVLDALKQRNQEAGRGSH